MTKTMAEVLAAHYESAMEFGGIGGGWVSGCICAWDSTVQQTYGMAKVAHARHAAAALTAAGFGDVREAKAPTVIHVHHDTEAHARSFNEGYEAAVTQGLADDPTLADDWFQDKLREAKAQAWEQCADGYVEQLASITLGWEELDNPHRAAAVRGDG